MRLSNCASDALVVGTALIQLHHYSLGILFAPFLVKYLPISLVPLERKVSCVSDYVPK